MNRVKEKFFVGTSGWSYSHWKGVFYPEDWPQSRWFDFYAEKFSTVEVNATFYRTFKDPTYETWRRRAPSGFRYVLKAPKWITHRKYLQDVELEIETFQRSAALLGDTLGLVLLQLAPGTPYDPGRLRKALLAFKDPSRIAVEFRNSQWITEEIRALLQESRSVFCSVDSPEAQLMDWVTSDVAYIRLHGHKQWYGYNYSDQELRHICDLAKKMAALGAQRIYIFFNNDFGGCAPKNALVLQEMLSK